MHPLLVLLFQAVPHSFFFRQPFVLHYSLKPPEVLCFLVGTMDFEAQEGMHVTMALFLDLTICRVALSSPLCCSFLYPAAARKADMDDVQKMFTMLSSHCFDHCVTNFRDRVLSTKEIKCVNTCGDKYTKVLARAGQRFAEELWASAPEARKAAEALQAGEHR